MRPLGDRRRRIRLEVVGSLWGTLEVDRRATLVNISRTGALILSPVAAAVDSTQSVKLTIEGHEVKLAARVRHLHRVTPSSGAPQYQIGLEFLEAPAVLEHAFE
jgi:PilZ domain-containing protein